MPEKTKTSTRGRPTTGQKSSIRKPLSLLKVGWGFLAALLLVSLSVSSYLGWYSVNEYCASSAQAQGIKVSFAGPAFLPVGDEAQFLVTVVNERSTTANLALDLRYMGTLLCSAGPEESHRANLGPVQPGERASRKITVLFPVCMRDLAWQQNWPGKRAEFEIWLAVDGQPPERVDTISLPVAPVPLPRTLGKWAAGWLAGLALWIGKELWDLIKKTAEPDVSKARSKT